MSFKLVCVAASETRKLAKAGFRKHCKKKHQKNTTPVMNMLQNEGPEKWFLGAFWGVYLSMVSRASQGGSHAQKHLKMQPQTCILCFFRTMFSSSLETLWKYFVCSMNNQILVFDAQFTVVFASAGGANLPWFTPHDSSSVIPSLWILFQSFLLHDSTSLISLPGFFKLVYKETLFGLIICILLHNVHPHASARG